MKEIVSGKTIEEKKEIIKKFFSNNRFLPIFSKEHVQAKSLNVDLQIYKRGLPLTNIRYYYLIYTDNSVYLCAFTLSGMTFMPFKDAEIQLRKVMNELTPLLQAS